MLRLPASVLASSLALVTLLAAAAGCGADAPSAAQCGKLLDHLVELEIGADLAAALAPTLHPR